MSQPQPPNPEVVKLPSDRNLGESQPQQDPPGGKDPYDRSL